MATFLDRHALNSIFAAAGLVRKKAEARAQEREVTLYLVRTLKSSRKTPPLPLQIFKTLQSTAIQTFGGQTFRDLSDGLVGVFERPADAIKTALHALHVCDIGSELYSLPPCHISIVQGPVTISPDFEISGKAYNRAGKILGRAEAGEAIFEPSVLKVPLTGYHDIMPGELRRGKIPGLGPVTTQTVRPLGLKRELDDELEDVDAELRSNRRT